MGLDQLHRSTICVGSSSGRCDRRANFQPSGPNLAVDEMLAKMLSWTTSSDPLHEMGNTSSYRAASSPAASASSATAMVESPSKTRPTSISGGSPRSDAETQSASPATAMTCPMAFKKEGLEKVCAIPDGKDFLIHTPRQNTLFTRACYSDKMHASAVRCISWCTPMGLSFEHTNLFLARPGEKTLVELWAPRLKKCPVGYSMLSDRGFADTARFYPNMNKQLTPKFLRGRKQFTAEEVSADRTICKLRYTCEVAFSRVTQTKGLRDVISHDFFVTLDAMNHWGHATVNIMKPLMPLK
ncbi:hypothetical protein THAOC_22356 [Thalassiosira oceanica]|uniref:DDE Tnp4 domain-containing protein n=1 Tax=Thalassiosira oceanica TaxID=159749 RepID=K0RYQ0_THAOC|nr:hypothetical protein THAOC_22356 [Thalassiosira oceanica]|eukprot:EJK57584.1 hypothetical protein THAOC_22356 [Thalassiosira oceanica]